MDRGLADNVPSLPLRRLPVCARGYQPWLYFRFPLNLRMVEEMPAARGIIVSHKSVRQ
jgi:putative transposase